MREAPADKKPGKATSRRSSRVAQQGGRRDLQEDPTRDELLESLWPALESGIDLRVCEEHPVATHGDPKEHLLEVRGKLPVGRLDQDVGAALAVRDQAQLLIVRAQRPDHVDLSADHNLRRRAIRSAIVQRGACGRDAGRVDSRKV